MGGFLDSILGLGSTSNTDAATAQGQTDLRRATRNSNALLDAAAGRAGDDIRAGAQGATDALNTNFGNAKTDITSYGGQSTGALTSAIDQAVKTVQGSNGGYQPFLDSGTGASTMLANSYGLNGASGNAAATSAFQASPGYGFQVDQATDAAARKAASLGMAGSGNTLDAITRLSSNLANQEYSNWQSGLSGLSGQGLTAASGMSSDNQSAGGIQASGGSTLANLYNTIGSGLGTIDTGLGTDLANVQTGMGNSLAGIETGTASQKSGNLMTSAGNIANLGMTDAQAQDTADNANSGILSKLFGGVLGLPLGGNTLNPGGLQLTPSTGGGLNISSAPASNPGLLGNAFANASKAVGGALKF